MNIKLFNCFEDALERYSQEGLTDISYNDAVKTLQLVWLDKIGQDDPLTVKENENPVPETKNRVDYYSIMNVSKWEEDYNG